ncbi:glycosyltransferase family 2 protein [Euhalothece natronophila Z-M001]|uniref:Glycosyltransferase family 2 protein n=1 Tax=Euhalothece natronophila Z-M001 TaxID=522448 RepID=A0A5B8NTN0_9CHRO|nr:glycosyltransferase family 2 protein [Euhalothece natronophila]QDZ41400.1 glycosyltransferase family 2 protein [Euhalothece natronophila Z-M001]
MQNITLSVVIPCYNEQDNIDLLLKRLLAVIDQLNLTFEIICVNDSSKDDTLNCLIQHHKINPQIKVINLSRNFGKEIALTAGIDYAIGDAVIPMDADLQDPPELIEQLVAKWREGYDVVYATRRSRHGESWLKRWSAYAFYQIAQHLSEVPIPLNTGDFRLLDRQVVEALKQMPERTRFMKGLFAWVGFRQTAVLYERTPRYKGSTTWNYWRLWNFALDGITSFSSLPLKIWSYLGITFSFLAFLYGSFLIIRTLIWGVDVPGYASLIVTILFLGGLQLISLGMIGEYLSRLYQEVKGRPLYLVRDCYGFDHDRPQPPLVKGGEGGI